MSAPLFPGIDDEQTLPADQRAVLDETRRMLDHVGATNDPALRTSARVERLRRADQLFLELSEADGGLTIEVSVGEDEVIISMGEGEAWNDHWHFAPIGNDVYGNVPDRPWTSLVVDFLAELLHGEVRVRATYRGDHLLKLHTEVIGSDGEPLTSGPPGR